MKLSIKAASIVMITGLIAVGLSVPKRVSAQTGGHSGPQPGNPYFSSTLLTIRDGIKIEKDTIGGPPKPPPGYEQERAAVNLSSPTQVLGSSLLNVPAYEWVFGCSAVSAAMIAGYYDNNGYPNMYTGPVNSGAAPYDSTPWPLWIDSIGDVYPNNPIIASHQGVDSRNTRGSIDDYWQFYDSYSQDPYILGGWPQHSWGDAVGDYMKTSQSAYDNPDGATSFVNWPYSTPFTCSNMAASGYSSWDGTYGRKLFYEARGYTVTDCYYQRTDNQVAGGFSFAQFKAEIDAGRPVLLSLEGHSIVGVGYDAASNTIYFHDTWDTLTHSMTWGASYTGLPLRAVSIVNLLPPLGTFSKSSPPDGAGSQPANLTLSWGTSAGATSYEVCYDKTDNKTCDSSWLTAGSATILGIPDFDSGATYYWQVRARSATGELEANGGNWWRFSEAYRPPTIAAFSPSTGFQMMSVSVTGTNFTGATAVGFNGVSAAFSVISPTTISAVVPLGATTGKITVTTPGGTATSILDFTITQPVYVQFSDPVFNAPENSGIMSVLVRLSRSSSQAVTVNYATSNGTAAAGVNYTAASGTLTFNPDETSKFIGVGIIDDLVYSPDNKTALLTLSSPVNAVLAGSNPAVITIIESDPIPEAHSLFIPLTMR